MFARVFIANRGEIALRVVRTLRELDIKSVAGYSDADRDALFVSEADEAYRIGPAPARQSYLDIDAVLTAARQSGADAVHPGYGFLAENAAFARAVTKAGLVFIGPSAEAIATMGDKVAARRAVADVGVPTVPGTPGPVESTDDARRLAAGVGYPVAVKASGGGGGRGIRVVRSPDEMATALEAARREAEASFKNPEVYLERYFDDPRHVEIQVLGDRHGNLVHLGERDCSIQRRHQKLIEETPSPAVDRDLRERMGAAALRAAAAVSYTSAGTVEFLLTRDGEFYFLEMNTRIQVEHPITERVTGIDLIREMVLIAAGEPMSVRGSFLDLNGHAIEVRVNAENPLQGFRPAPATITRYVPPGGIGIRLDSGVSAGYTIPSDYDSLIAKVIAWGPDREQARRRLLRALDEYEIVGPQTTIPFLEAVLASPTFIAGDAGTTFVERELPRLTAQIEPVDQSPPVPGEEIGPRRRFDVEVNRKLFRVEIAERTARAPKRPAGRSGSGRRTSSLDGNSLVSPMHGTVISVTREVGAPVRVGDTILVIEAMKMENDIPAHRTGTLAAISVQPGETVETDQLLATIE